MNTHIDAICGVSCVRYANNNASHLYIFVAIYMYDGPCISCEEVYQMHTREVYQEVYEEVYQEVYQMYTQEVYQMYVQEVYPRGCTWGSTTYKPRRCTRCMPRRCTRKCTRCIPRRRTRCMERPCASVSLIVYR